VLRRSNQRVVTTLAARAELRATGRIYSATTEADEVPLCSRVATCGSPRGSFITPCGCLMSFRAGVSDAERWVAALGLNTKILAGWG
jgi:hypothetical protein